jgi:hypothetical protein
MEHIRLQPLGADTQQRYVHAAGKVQHRVAARVLGGGADDLGGGACQTGLDVDRVGAVLAELGDRVSRT